MENIYKRLANGESSDAIAAEFTAALNEAMARHAKEEEERAARAEAERLAKAEAETRKMAKREDMATLLNDAFYYIAKHYPELGLGPEDLNDEELFAIADMVILMLDLEVLKATHKNGEVKMKPRVTVKTAKSGEERKLSEDPFTAFFRELGL